MQYNIVNEFSNTNILVAYSSSLNSFEAKFSIRQSKMNFRQVYTVCIEISVNSASSLMCL